MAVTALLEPGLVVDLVLDGGWRRTATVSSVATDAIGLAPCGGPLSLPGQLRWCQAALEWRAGGAAARTDGILHTLEGGALSLAPIHAPERVQRRRFVRVQAEVPAAIVAPDFGRMLAQTVDLSVGGMLVSDAQTLEVGRRIRFALDLSGEVVAGDGEVVRGTAAGARGVRFDELPASAERALSRFVAERQRQKMALA
ncbi:PilZ domain-containing protein [Conexibacter sp. SYSU D00693]|uniref:PilZ domain-containing protein n=1 Tax=Conexibacter sp. SYSU D00693 TaxID=2812560 RepID=UPI00196A70F9|nr:PilZ domain-containing protein [Conexibacter sp. SYSU D00693]